MESSNGRATSGVGQGATIGGELMASIVVFLVALPLCMGVAIASNVPPALGLISGIVGGLVVGSLAGQPLQVSGPAAGLAVMVWQLVADFGIAALGLAVLITGAVQVAAALVGLGRWFRAVSPAVIQGMLGGIGVVIFASQFHIMIDDKPTGAGLSDLLSIPSAVYKSIFPPAGDVYHLAAGVGILTIVSILLWNRFRPTKLKALPGPLVGVVVAVLVTTAFSLPTARVGVPDSLVDSINWINSGTLNLLGSYSFWAAVLALTMIASAETLLCATAVDRIHDGPRTDYKKELMAQGVGNLVCGVFGALPVTGVIVRSSANVEAGGKTRWAAILHGAWILLLVVFLPEVLTLVPTASLAAILVYTGVKLLNIPAARKLAQKGRWELFIWAATIVMIVVTDLLVGVAAGFALALLRLLIDFSHLEVRVEKSEMRHDVLLIGAATFMSLPKLATVLEAIPDGAEVHFHLDAMTYIDHACIELIEDWHERHPGEVTLETDRLLPSVRQTSLAV